jgi:hypothetical protein
MHPRLAEVAYTPKWGATSFANDDFAAINSRVTEFTGLSVIIGTFDQSASQSVGGTGWAKLERDDTAH